MAGKSTKFDDPRYEEFIRKNGPLLGFQSKQLAKEFNEEFGVNFSYNSILMFARRIAGGSHVIPVSTKPDLTDLILNLKCTAALITSDWQLPFHDREWAEFAYEIGRGFGCDLHVINGDFLDGHSLSKFDPQIYDMQRGPEEELVLAEEILFQSCKRFGKTVLDMGNHEWRYWRLWMKASIGPERFLRLITDEDRVELTQLSYVILNEGVWYGGEKYPGLRCTHPRNYSRIPTRVGSDLASKYQMHIVGAHGHNIGIRRDISSRYTVIDSGGMFDPKRLDYINSVDSTNPKVNQGFVIFSRGKLYLFDALNCDREFWRWVVSKKGYFPAPAEV